MRQSIVTPLMRGFFIRVFSPVFFCMPVAQLLAEAPDGYENSLGMTMIRVEPGEFTMGGSPPTEPDEAPAREVTLSGSFSVSSGEVTVAQFREFRPDYAGPGNPGDAVVGISWDEAVAFCNWLSLREGVHYRLPTEAEWEYLNKGHYDAEGNPGAFPGLEGLITAPGEWCLDGYGLYSGGDAVDPTGNARSQLRVIRGMPEADAATARVADRFALPPSLFPIPADRLSSGDPVAARFNIWMDLLSPQARYAREDEADSRNAGNSDSGRVTVRRPVISAGQFPPPPVEAETSSEAAPPEEIRVPEAPVDAISEPESPVRVSFGAGAPEARPDQLHLAGELPKVGFRIVEDPQGGRQLAMPVSKPPAFHRTAVKPIRVSMPDLGPPPDAPYLRKRNPLPPAVPVAVREALDMHPGMGDLAGGAALAACRNGDLLAVFAAGLSGRQETTGLFAMRLRLGAETWDMPELLVDLPDQADVHPVLLQAGSGLWLFWNSHGHGYGRPFLYMKSLDHGASWSGIAPPLFEHHESAFAPPGAFLAGSAFVDSDGTIRLAAVLEDTSGTVFYVSRNGGRSWILEPASVPGHHPVFAPLADGGILGAGQAPDASDNSLHYFYRNQAGESSWTPERTALPATGRGQRAILIRLQSGALVYAGDFQDIEGKQDRRFDRKGAYIAISEDSGLSWDLKPLPGIPLHGDPEVAEAMGGGTLGLAAAAQGPDGMIHVLTSAGGVMQHVSLNEAWIRERNLDGRDEESLFRNTAGSINNIRKVSMDWPGGSSWMEASYGIGDDGRPLLHGRETWYYPQGNKFWEVTYNVGRMIGRESFWLENGTLYWSRNHRPDGITELTRYGPDRVIRSVSEWKGKQLHGEVRVFNRDGELEQTYIFEDGARVDG